jgi:hypothetical protein
MLSGWIAPWRAGTHEPTGGNTVCWIEAEIDRCLRSAQFRVGESSDGRPLPAVGRFAKRLQSTTDAAPNRPAPTQKATGMIYVVAELATNRQRVTSWYPPWYPKRKKPLTEHSLIYLNH